MALTDNLPVHTKVCRNGAVNPANNIFSIVQVHVSESGKLLRYLAYHAASNGMISIYAKDLERWHVVP